MMRSWKRRAAAGALTLLASAACSNPFGRQYEYEEQLYLSVDGSATVIINSSIPALVALRNLPFDPSSTARVDRDLVQQTFASSGCADVRVGQPWVRRGRHFVQVRLSAAHVADLAGCRPLGWSTYAFTPKDGTIDYRQVVGPPSAGNVGSVNWDGTEIVGFKLHLPSQILFHNVKRLEDGTNGEAARGNILAWEQWLADRRAGKPLEMEVRMEAESILHRTLWLFAGAFASAVLALAGVVWWTIARARRRPLGARPAGGQQPN